ncbi:hypothetical protein LNP20_23825 [Klebsiella pneumoniae subsp. pneumoniae]|nr:hypothetical protein [Klebsiella pneumoniae subsp. pneumoniae]
MISLIAVLKAKPGQTDALRQALQALLLPTRQEPGKPRLCPVSAARRAGHLLYARGVAGTGRPRCPCRDALFSRRL